MKMYENDGRIWKECSVPLGCPMQTHKKVRWSCLGRVDSARRHDRGCTEIWQTEDLKNAKTKKCLRRKITSPVNSDATLHDWLFFCLKMIRYLNISTYAKMRGNTDLEQHPWDYITGIHTTVCGIWACYGLPIFMLWHFVVKLLGLLLGGSLGKLQDPEAPPEAKQTVSNSQTLQLYASLPRN
jgi:hypothetical protein